MDTNGLSVGDFVEIYPRSDSSWNYDHFGIIFGFEDRGIDGVSARILWLTEDCHNSVHWNIYMLGKISEPEEIDWKEGMSRASMWFNQMYGRG